MTSMILSTFGELSPAYVGLCSSSWCGILNAKLQPQSNAAWLSSDMALL